ncbi:hypothetical protein [Mycoplasma buteonis]|uniref:hypothetical protein n=1 Tax=Mycoplasma buteonis TaxID=171280 RepID=UPI00055F026B|nr:hypothetical protein [Mycoplasma buteonis]
MQYVILVWAIISLFTLYYLEIIREVKFLYKSGLYTKNIKRRIWKKFNVLWISIIITISLMIPYLIIMINYFNSNEAPQDFDKVIWLTPIIILGFSSLIWIYVLISFFIFISKMKNNFKIKLVDYQKFSLEETNISFDFKNSYILKKIRNFKSIEIDLPSHIRTALAFKKRESDAYYEQIVFSLITYLSWCPVSNSNTDFYEVKPENLEKSVLFILKYFFKTYQKELKINLFKYEAAIKKVLN